MAKLKAPLMSFGARGKLAQAVVYFPWKGIDCVREYVIPANPRSDPQQIQRGHFETAVDWWHSLAYTDADRIAWNRYAGTLAKIMAGFNAFMRLCIASNIAVIPWSPNSDIQIDTPTVNGFDVDIEASVVGASFRAAIGTRRTHFPTHVPLVDDGDNTYSLTWAGGVTGTDYYVKVEEQQGGIWYQRSGIYHVKTS